VHVTRNAVLRERSIVLGSVRDEIAIIGKAEATVYAPPYFAYNSLVECT
jgi:hypothetical protein